jgi:hypothetical protein
MDSCMQDPAWPGTAALPCSGGAEARGRKKGREGGREKTIRAGPHSSCRHATQNAWPNVARLKRSNLRFPIRLRPDPSRDPGGMGGGCTVFPLFLPPGGAKVPLLQARCARVHWSTLTGGLAGRVPLRLAEDAIRRTKFSVQRRPAGERCRYATRPAMPGRRACHLAPLCVAWALRGGTRRLSWASEAAFLAASASPVRWPPPSFGALPDDTRPCWRSALNTRISGSDLLIPGIGRERVDWEMGNQEKIAGTTAAVPWNGRVPGCRRSHCIPARSGDWEVRRGKP